MRQLLLPLLTSLRLRGALWIAILVVGLTTIACTSPNGLLSGTGLRSADGLPPSGTNAIGVAIRMNEPMSTQATGFKSVADINHFTIKLFDWTGSALGSQREVHATGSGTVAGMYFTNVPSGMYKVTAEAFSSANDSVTITTGGAQTSSNFVTVNAGATPPTYSSGTTLAVAMTLLNGTGDTIGAVLTINNGQTSVRAHMAPFDAGSETALHDISLVSVDGGTCAFTWIPRFDAFQLANAANCGSTSRFGTIDSVRPNGYWVTSQPSAGTSGSDYVKVSFGGFYAGKYEVSRKDATTSSQGTSTVASVRQFVAPWTNISFDSAAEVCGFIDPHASLMGDQEWTALAVYAMINNIDVRGNNNGSGGDVNGGVTTLDETSQAGTLRSQTGSGGTITSHTGTTYGVYDLNGNVSEWTRDVNRTPGGTWSVGEFGFAPSVPTTTDFVVSLQTVASLRLFGVPIVGASGIGEFGNDKLVGITGPSPTRVHRGGMYFDGADAGLWYVNVSKANNDATLDYVGFRPMLKF